MTPNTFIEGWNRGPQGYGDSHKEKGVVPGKGRGRICDIPNCIKIPTKNVKREKESIRITYHGCEGHVEHALRWPIHKPEDYYGLKNKHKEDDERNNKYYNESNNENQDDSNPIWKSMMLYTLIQEESDSEWWLWPMRNVFIGLSIIMFLAKVSTFPEILMQTMLVFGGVLKLKVWEHPG